MPLKYMVEYIEAKESGKRSASRLLDPQSTDTISSSYRRGKQQDARTKGRSKPEKPKTNLVGVCIYCGKVGHGKTPQAPSAPGTVKSAGNVAARTNSTKHAGAAG